MHPSFDAPFQKITGVVRSASAHTTQITWSSVAGKQYVVEASGDLTSAGYTAVSGVMTATGTTTAFTDNSANTREFCRVRVVQ